MTSIKQLQQLSGVYEMPSVKPKDAVQIDKFAANKGNDPTNPGSFIQTQLERFPFQPPMPAGHKALSTDERLDHPPKPISDLSWLDSALHRHALADARLAAEKQRVDNRHAIEQQTAKLFVSGEIQKEIHRRDEFFAKAKQIVDSRLDGQAKAKKLMHEYFNYLRENSTKIALGWTVDTRRRIEEADANRREWMEWKLYQLFTLSMTGAITRAPGRGQKVEVAAGEMYARQVDKQVENSWAWRKSNRFFESANGNIVRDPRGLGEIPETVLNNLFAPLFADRTERFQDWREGDSLISTPNGGLIHFAGQGSMPEKANEELFAPTRELRTKKHWDFHLGGRLITLPNGSLTPNAGQGIEPGVALGEKYWPDRDQVTADHKTWHDNFMAGPTPNGGVAPLPGVGESPIKVGADHAQPIKLQRTEGHSQWHANYMFQSTSNGGYSPRPGVGQSVGKITADQAQPIIDQRTDLASDWHATHRYAKTPNGAFAPLKNVGNMIEKAFAQYHTPILDKAQQQTNAWHKSHQFGPTANGGFSPLPNVGQSYEKESSDQAVSIVHQRIEQSTNAHEANRSVPSDNGSILQLKVVGQNSETTMADLDAMTKDEIEKSWVGERAKAKENFREAVENQNVDVSKTYRDTELSERREQAVQRANPLPSAGEPQAEALKELADFRRLKQHPALREIQKNLAAHEPAVSQFQQHAIKKDGV